MWEFIRTTPPHQLAIALAGAVTVLLIVAIVILLRTGKHGTMELRSRWVLLALDDEGRAHQFLEAFQKAGWDTQVLPDTAGLGEFLAGFHPSLLVVDPTRYGSELAKLEANDARVASTPVILLDDPGVERRQAPMRAHVGRNAKPFEVVHKAIRLVELTPEPQQLSRRTEVQGPIQAGTLLELLYFLANARRTGRVELSAKPYTGWIWIEKGEVRHCQVGRGEGVRALNFLLDLPEGRFSFKAGIGSPSITIKDPTFFLLHEYARLRDERAKMVGH
jgi:hypothetical protein